MPVAIPLAAAAATIGGAAITAGSTSSAANRAADATTAANQAAIAEQQRQFDITDKRLSPWVEQGAAALPQQSDLLGLNGPQKQAAAIAALKDGPLYSALFENGQNTILANASATGGLRGGDTQSSLFTHGRDTLATVIENQLSKLGGVSAMGESAAAQTGTFGANASTNIANLLSDSGSARAGAATAAGAANASLMKDITSQIVGLIGNKDVQTAIGKAF